MAAAPQQKPKIDISAGSYRLLMMSPAMVTNAWVEWVNDPAVMEPLNVRAARLSKTDLQRYVAASHAQKKAIVGIFRRNGEQHVGLYEIAMDEQHRNAGVEMLVDTRKFDFEKVADETLPPLIVHLQKRFNIGKFTALVPETYHSALRFFGGSNWEQEAVLREELPSLIQGERIAVHQFGLVAG